MDNARASEGALVSSGLDLVRWFRVDEANRELPREFWFPQAGRIGVVIGNSRALWEPFVRWRAERRRSRHPLDEYVENSVREALKPLAPTWLAFAHHLSPRPIPIQRYAAASGLSQMSPVGLSIHPRFGPWIALRAVALFDSNEVPRQPPSEAHPCRDCSRPCLEPFRAAMEQPVRSAQHFLQVRNVCPAGAQHRYTPAQVHYHYDIPLVEDAD